MKKIMLLAICMVASIQFLRGQCGMVSIPLQERISESSLIVEAKVVHQEGVWATNKDVIMTLNTLEVYKVFKGNVVSETIDILTYGGTIDLTHDKVNIGLELMLGETGIFTLRPATVTLGRSGTFYEAFAAKQGFLRYSRVNGAARDYQTSFDNYTQVYSAIQSATRSNYRELKSLDFKYGTVTNSSRAPGITSFNISGSGTSGNAGVGDVLTINGTGFDPDGDGTPTETNGVNTGTGGVFYSDANAGGGFVLGLNTNDMILSWTDTQIQVELPTRAGTGQFGVQVYNPATDAAENEFSGSNITINYAHLNVQADIDASIAGNETWETRLVNKDASTTGYPFQYNTDLVATAGAADTYDDIISTWRCSTGVYFDRGADTSVQADANDDINIVMFDGTIIDSDPDLTGVLAYARSRYSGCSSTTEAWWHVEEMDVVINDAITWYYDEALPVPGGEYDFETVILHELGHTHQLGHVINTAEVMHYAIGSGQSKRSLSSNDLNGAAYVVGKSTAATVCDVVPGIDIEPMTTYTAPAPTVICQDISVALDSDGTVSITSNDVDNGSFSECGTIDTITISKTTFTCSDLGDNTVTLTVTDTDGMSSSCDATITITGDGVSTYAGGSWSNGGPSRTKALVVSDNLTTSGGALEGCSCTVEAGATLTVTENNPLVVGADIAINGNVVVQNNASIVQEDEGAIVNVASTGNFQMVRTTAAMSGRDFTFMSSPVGQESRNGVFNSARKVIGIIPANFTADTNVSAQFPDAENFLSVDNTYLNQFNTDVALTPGEGYLVYPQDLSVPDSSPATATFTYEADGAAGETVNGGPITFPVYDDEVKSENFNLIGNPYPSGISAPVLISENPSISEIYFWEHSNDPSPSVMGYLNANYSMEDFTVCNQIGCAAGGDLGDIVASSATIISAGQGFAIKAEQNAAIEVTFTNAMRTTGNNTFRNQQSEEDRIWVKIENDDYSLYSQTLIGFDENATAGIDKGYDSKRNATILNIFSTPKSGEYLSIQGRESFTSDMEIDLGYSSVVEEALSYRISLENVTGVNLNEQPIYLIDKLLSTYVNLKERSYEFTSGSVTVSDRFTLVFEQPETLGTEELDAFDQEVTLYPNPSQGEITITYSGNAPLSQASISDINGKIIQTIDLSRFSGKQELDVRTLSSGVYFVTIQSASEQAVKKLIIR